MASITSENTDGADLVVKRTASSTSERSAMEQEEDGGYGYCPLSDRHQSTEYGDSPPLRPFADVSRHSFDQTSATNIATDLTSCITDDRRPLTPDCDYADNDGDDATLAAAAPAMNASPDFAPPPASSAGKRGRTGKYSRQQRRRCRGGGSGAARQRRGGVTAAKRTQAKRGVKRSPSSKERKRKKDDASGSNSGRQCRRRRGSSRTRRSRTRTRKRTRDPSRPKRPISAFILFMNEFRRKHADTYKGLDVRDVTRMGGQVWNSMSLKKKCEYQQEANHLQEAYAESMKLYRAAAARAKTGRRRPETAYQVFLRKFYNEHKNDRRCPTPKDVLIKGARKWRRMTLREKMPYMDQSDDLHVALKESVSREAGDLGVRFVDERPPGGEREATCSDWGYGPHEHAHSVAACSADGYSGTSASRPTDYRRPDSADEASQCYLIPLHHAVSDASLAEQAKTEAAEEAAASHRAAATASAASRKSGGIMDFFSHRFRADHADSG